MSTLFSRTYEVVLRQLKEMPLFLQQSLSGLSPQLLRQQPLCDDMPLLEHLCHVRDCDSDLYGLRIRRILNEPTTPLLEPVQVGAWPKERRYLSQESNAVLEDLAQVRSELLGKLRRLTEGELIKVGHRADGSEMTVLDIIAQIAEHDWDHKCRIAAILKEFAGGVIRNGLPGTTA